MLKIKENVDLKELEKYGFKLEYANTYSKSISKDNEISILNDREIEIEVEEGCGLNNKDLHTIYDLITNDLVEKVESDK